jgi:short-subunit dehydrogenase
VVLNSQDSKTLVIYSAGIAQPGGFLAPDSEEVTRGLFETNVYGVLRVSKAFAPRTSLA